MSPERPAIGMVELTPTAAERSFSEALQITRDRVFGGLGVHARTFVTDEAGLVTWAELAEANDEETMEVIGRLAVGERAVFGMSDTVDRVS